MRTFKHLAIAAVAMITFHSTTVESYPLTPKIWLHPGHLCSVTDKDFQDFRYNEKIPYCKRNVSNSTKNKICEIYGIYDRTDYTVDHIIPLSLGGSNDERNLWCQSRKIYTGNLEYYYYIQVRDGKIRQVDAVHALMAWKFNPVGKDHVPSPPSE